jgi:hypothetical protein
MILFAGRSRDSENNRMEAQNRGTKNGVFADKRKDF